MPAWNITVVGEPLPVELEPSEIPDALWGSLKPANGRWCSTCPGVLAARGRLILILPRVYAGASAEASDRVPLVFLAALCRVLRDGERQRKTRRSVVESELSLDQALVATPDAARLLDQLEAAMLLLRDYREHGLIAIHERQTGSHVRGATHWPRTLSRSVAVVSGPSVTLSQHVQTQQRIARQHALTQLHERVCAEIRALLDRDAPSTTPPTQPTARHDDLEILDRHERALFQDRHRVVAGLLRRYLGAAGLGTATGSKQVSGLLAVDFPAVWEYMLAFVLGPARISPLPRGAYQREGSGADPSNAHGLHLKPDLVIDGRVDNADVLVVLDAKDYAPVLTKHWPATESIGKQLLYRYLLSDRHKPGQHAFDKIGNAFLLPARLSHAAGHARCAVHDIAGEQGPAPFGRIVCLDVDFERVARGYAYGQRDAELRRAIVETVMVAMHVRS